MHSHYRSSHTAVAFENLPVSTFGCPRVFTQSACITLQRTCLIASFVRPVPYRWVRQLHNGCILVQINICTYGMSVFKSHSQAQCPCFTRFCSLDCMIRCGRHYHLPPMYFSNESYSCQSSPRLTSSFGPLQTTGRLLK